MKRLVWTISVAFAGVFLTARSAPLHWEGVLLGAIIGGAIGLGFGSIFSCANTLIAVIYWVITFAIIGFAVGLEEPVNSTRLAERSGYGAGIGFLAGSVSHLVSVRSKARASG
jgi:predicted lipid-binding transport protein (Tim44 family)